MREISKSCQIRRVSYDNTVMRDLSIILIHLLVTISRVLGPGGARSVVAESLPVKQQILIVNRSIARAPVLRPTDRVIVGLCAIVEMKRRNPKFGYQRIADQIALVFEAEIDK